MKVSKVACVWYMWRTVFRDNACGSMKRSKWETKRFQTYDNELNN